MTSLPHTSRILAGSATSAIWGSSTSPLPTSRSGSRTERRTSSGDSPPPALARSLRRPFAPRRHSTRTGEASGRTSQRFGRRPASRAHAHPHRRRRHTNDRPSLPPRRNQLSYQSAPLEQSVSYATLTETGRPSRTRAENAPWPATSSTRPGFRGSCGFRRGRCGRRGPRSKGLSSRFRQNRSGLTRS